MLLSKSTQTGWMVLLKFGKKEHLRAFRDDGILYMNTLDYFSNLESDVPRSDRLEGTDVIIQPQFIKDLVISNPITNFTVRMTPTDLGGPITMANTQVAACNIYCLFAVTRPVDGGFVDQRNFEFGDSFVLILKTQEFINRVSTTINAMGLGCKHGLVAYYDPNEHSGKTGPFCKASAFAYQNEYRFLASPSNGTPLRTIVGGLSDITSDVLPLPEINRLVDFGTESAREAGLSW